MIATNFMIDMGPPVRVRCNRCKGWCESIELTDFTMFFCTNHLCVNVHELRHMTDGSWTTHDYGTVVEAPEVMQEFKALLMKPRPTYPKLSVIK
ncbi:MAG: hypothetical protein RBT11_19390 [Desulfobacterales bacterium]|nr:hypothetical protein [Desulfobacterales bacterium]